MDLQDNKKNKRKWKNRDVISSLEFALTGIFTAIKEERNMRNHAVSAVVVVLAGFLFQVSAIAFEIMNSAIENVVDLASDYHFSIRAKNAKDMAAGAVLVVSGFAVVTGLVIFIPKIWNLIF